MYIYYVLKIIARSDLEQTESRIERVRIKEKYVQPNNIIINTREWYAYYMGILQTRDSIKQLFL